MSRPLRIANCSGFYGDRLEAPGLLLEGPDPIDVLTGDYLAELTMLILWKSRQRDGRLGYATTFLTQMEHYLATCIERGIRVVVNAGGLNPRGLKAKLDELALVLGLDVATAAVCGDDLAPEVDALLAAGEPLLHLDTGLPFSSTGRQALTANAYLGGWGIARALDAGAQVVVTGRVTDAALVLGPGAHHHGWSPDDWDQLAGAVVAGHVIECGTQATGGNYCFLDELSDARFPGFPICELAEDGSSVLTKQPGSGGLVSVGTVTAQLLYEIAEPTYANPDVVADFTSITLTQLGPDRVGIGPVKGLPAPPELKVALNYEAGFKNQMSIVVTGLDIEAKAARATAMLFEILGGQDQFDGVTTTLLRSDEPDAERNDQAQARLRIMVKGRDRDLVGRRFSRAVIELTLAAYAGFFAETLPGDATSYGVYWPTLVDPSVVTHTVVLPDGTEVVVEDGPRSQGMTQSEPPASPLVVNDAEPSTERVLLGQLLGARSGDKGGNANVGFWATDEVVGAWLQDCFNIEQFRSLLPEADGLEVRRFALPNLAAVNFVVVGLLGEGVASSTRLDPQGKGLGEYLRSRSILVPPSVAERRRS